MAERVAPPLLTEEFKCTYCKTKTTLLESLGRRECTKRHALGLEHGVYHCCKGDPDFRHKRGCVRSDHVPNTIIETIPVPLWLVHSSRNPKGEIHLSREQLAVDRCKVVEGSEQGSVDLDKSYHVVRLFDKKKTDEFN